MSNQVLKIRGGSSLFGNVYLPSNKNAILPILCASILVKGKITIEQVTKSPDVFKLIDALEKIGSDCKWLQEDLLIDTKNVDSYEIDSCVSDIQAGILFAGPLLARFGKAIIPHGKGCKLGYRGPEKHIDFFKKVGVSSHEDGGKIYFTEDVPKKDFPLNKLGPIKEGVDIKEVSFGKPAVTPTENVLMYLSGRPEEIWSLHGLAQEPHVDDLVSFLNLVSSTEVIKGYGSSRKVQGTTERKSDMTFRTQLDHVDAAGWISLTAITKGNITLKNVYERTKSIVNIIDFFKPFGIKFQRDGDDLEVCCEDYVFAPDETVERYNEFSWKIVPGPWPQEAVDTLASFAALATTNRQLGTEVQIINHMFEDGLRYAICFRDIGFGIVEQNMMFAIRGNDPSVVNSVVTAPDVIEGVRAVIWAILGLPKGSEVIVRNWHPILRRNPEIIKILKELGADIEIIEQEN